MAAFVANVVETSGSLRRIRCTETPYLRHFLGFIGLHDVRVIDATCLMSDGTLPADHPLLATDLEALSEIEPW